MRILLDECVPRRLKRAFPRTYTVVTVPEAGYASLKNGALLRTIDGVFDVFLTTDTNLRYQQNLERYELAFVLLHAHSNDYVDLAPLVPKLLTRLGDIAAGRLLVIE